MKLKDILNTSAINTNTIETDTDSASDTSRLETTLEEETNDEELEEETTDEMLEEETNDEETKEETLKDFVSNMNKLGGIRVLNALYKLKRQEYNAKNYFKQKYGQDSLGYIIALNKYFNTYIGRHRLEENYKIEQWNLMQSVGMQGARELLDKIEKFMDKIEFKDNS
jgi:hypothetical protein